MINSEKLAKLIFFAAVVIFALSGARLAFERIDVEALPESLQQGVLIVISFLGSGVVTFVISLGRNLIGYGRNYWKEPEPYNIDRLYGTWMYYYGIIGTIVVLCEQYVPEPWNVAVVAFAAVITFVADFVFSELKKV